MTRDDWDIQQVLRQIMLFLEGNYQPEANELRKEIRRILEKQGVEV